MVALRGKRNQPERRLEIDIYYCAYCSGWILDHRHPNRMPQDMEHRGEYLFCGTGAQRWFEMPEPVRHGSHAVLTVSERDYSVPHQQVAEWAYPARFSLVHPGRLGQARPAAARGARPSHQRLGAKTLRPVLSIWMCVDDEQGHYQEVDMEDCPTLVARVQKDLDMPIGSIGFHFQVSLEQYVERSK